ncbi:hypothetical protein [Rubellicoccus peritrichatus]|uniref:Uncharacterized protein n=1 Tax=Rubellicoccus peritrichatus TaxID=3080537 RepID=A0AAQ3QTW1_9BACT|nr:hypothetical protein [Puniceicoccus sp. CR14]WOO39828.1 hypothetical protein RZN69_14480 [Puniceicoccus sp. CR14]
MKIISRKKRIFPIQSELNAYLRQYGRETNLPIEYKTLLRWQESLPLFDKNGTDTLWQTLIYERTMFEEINDALTRIYVQLKAAGNPEALDHLRVDRIDFCAFGNTQPFRVRIINQYNDNYDYFYVKQADASRVYGLELEELLSPSSINYLFHENTLIEQHIIGIPGDEFIRRHFQRKTINKVRVAKEFIKFNERCFVRLLGDMRSYNYVVRITPDFEDEQYRVRPIDFDQQSYEGRRTIYLPQFFKDNNAVVELCTGLLNYETMVQYQDEERALIARRANTAPYRLNNLKASMCDDEIALPEKTVQLARELAEYHSEPSFLDCKTMGEITFAHIEFLLGKVTNISLNW